MGNDFDIQENERVAHVVELIITKEKKIRDIDIAIKADISKSTMSQVLNKKRGVSKDFLRKFCTTYNVNEDYILKGEGEIFKTKTVSRETITEQYVIELLEENRGLLKEKAESKLTTTDDALAELKNQIDGLKANLKTVHEELMIVLGLLKTDLGQGAQIEHFLTKESDEQIRKRLNLKSRKHIQEIFALPVPNKETILKNVTSDGVV